MAEIGRCLLFVEPVHVPGSVLGGCHSVTQLVSQGEQRGLLHDPLRNRSAVEPGRRRFTEPTVEVELAQLDLVQPPER